MNLIGPIFLILTAVVAGICTLLVGATKTLRDSRDDQEKRIAYLESERTRDKEKIGRLETAVKFWRSAARGDETLEALAALVTGHAQEARENWATVTVLLTHLGKSIDTLVEKLGENT